MTIEDESKRIRRRIPALKAGRKRLFPSKLRSRILDWIDRAKEAGLRDADCSRLLGIPAPQFNAWRPRTAIVPFESSMDWTVERVSHELVPIKIPDGIELTSGVVVVSPTGYRVEGLSLEQAYALLREFQ